MATQRDKSYAVESPFDHDGPITIPHTTTIQAHTVLSISVSMSVTEMDVLMGSFGKAVHELNDTERMVQAEFTSAVHNLR